MLEDVWQGQNLDEWGEATKMSGGMFHSHIVVGILRAFAREVASFDAVLRKLVERCLTLLNSVEGCGD